MARVELQRLVARELGEVESLIIEKTDRQYRRKIDILALSPGSAGADSSSRPTGVQEQALQASAKVT